MKGKIFNAQEVQAIIAGNKTMFREVIKPYPIQLKGFSDVYFDCYSKGNPWNWYTKSNKQPLGTIAKCPYQVGQKIFCKERFFVSNYIELRYEANLSIDEKYYWLPAIKMKREHSRLTLEITDVKVERLGEISEEDCLDEGCYFAEVFLGDFSKPPRKIFNFSKKNLLKEDGLLDYKLAFKDNWNATHKKPEEKFEVNPFVWVVDFKINN